MSAVIGITSDSTVRPGTTVTFTADWDVDISRFTAGDMSAYFYNKTTFLFVLGSVAILNFTQVTARRYTFQIAIPSEATIEAANLAVNNIALNIRVSRETVSPENPRNFDQEFDIVLYPEVTISTTVERATPGVPFPVTLTWDQTVNDWDTDDITVQNGTKGTFRTQELVSTLMVTPPVSGRGEITVSVRENAVTEGNDAVSATFQYGFDPPVAPTGFQVSIAGSTAGRTATLTWTNPTETGGTPLTAVEYRFSESMEIDAAAEWIQLGVVESFTVAVNQSRHYTFQLRVVNRVGASPAVSASVVGLSIEAIDEQIITIGSKTYRLVVDVTGDPDTVEVTGFTEGFNFDWDEENDQLIIEAVEVFRLVAGAFWNIELKKGSDTLTGTITYNVIPAPPVIDDSVAVPALIRGDSYRFFVPVANNPTVLYGKALLTGIRDEAQITEDGDSGLLFFGDVPLGKNWTVEQAGLEVFASNELVGSDTHTFMADIVDIAYDNFYLTSVIGGRTSAIAKNDGASQPGTETVTPTILSSFTPSERPTVYAAATRNNEIYLLGQNAGVQFGDSNHKIFVVGKTDTGVGRIRRFFEFLPTSTGLGFYAEVPISIAIDGDDLYVLYAHPTTFLGTHCAVFDLTTIENEAVLDIRDDSIRRFDVESYRTDADFRYYDIAVDSDYLYAMQRFSSTQRRVRRVDKMTGGGSRTAPSEAFRTLSTDVRFTTTVSVDADNIYVCNSESRRVWIYNKSEITRWNGSVPPLNRAAIITRNQRIITV